MFDYSIWYSQPLYRIFIIIIISKGLGIKDWKQPTTLDWSKLGEYETQDMTIGSQELACAAGGCEIQ